MVPLLSLSNLLDLVNVCICLVYLGIEVYLENYDLFAMIVLVIGLAGAISGFLKYSLIIGIMTFMKGAVLLVLLVENPLAPHCPAWVKGVTTLFLGQLIFYSFGLTAAHLVRLRVRRDITAEDNIGLVDCEPETCTGCNLHRLDEEDDGFVHVQCAVNQDGQAILITAEHVDNCGKVNASYVVDETNCGSG